MAGAAADLGYGAPAGYADPSLGLAEIGYGYGLDATALAGLAEPASPPSAVDVLGLDAMQALGPAGVAEVMGLYGAGPSYGPDWSASAPAYAAGYDPYSATGWGAPSHAPGYDPFHSNPS